MKNKIMKSLMLAMVITTLSVGTTGCGMLEMIGLEKTTEKAENTEEQETKDKTTAPTITVNMSGDAVYGLNQKATPLSVEAEVTDGGTLTYQWYRNNVNSNGGGTPIDGATSKEYTPETTELGFNYYYVVIGNETEDETKSAGMTTSKTKCVTIQETAVPTEANEDTLSGGEWVKTSKGWWYKNADESYPASSWECIGGKWYRFDENGYMVKGWYSDGGRWYYLGKDGSMTIDWIKINGKWYYLRQDGSMATGWLQIDTQWYHLDGKGIMQTGWYQDGSDWYYLNEKGQMVTDTEIDGYKIGSDGVMLTDDAEGQSEEESDTTEDTTEDSAEE